MTRNQRHAIDLAQGICAGTLDPGSIADHDWHLLLLAAEINNGRSSPLAVGRKVLTRAALGVGYFRPADLPGHDVSRSTPAKSAVQHETRIWRNHTQYGGNSGFQP
jgi:hypothetical protein